MNPAYLFAIGSAVLFGAADFSGGLASRRAGVAVVTLTAWVAGLVTLAIVACFVPGRPGAHDFAWAAAAGAAGGRPASEGK